jgi:hypothetical protein
VHEADNLSAICEAIVWTMWEPRCLTSLQVSTTYKRDTFAFSYTFNIESRYEIKQTNSLAFSPQANYTD